jgi:hypothetical protein
VKLKSSDLRKEQLLKSVIEKSYLPPDNGVAATFRAETQFAITKAAVPCGKLVKVNTRQMKVVISFFTWNRRKLVT